MIRIVLLAILAGCAFNMQTADADGELLYNGIQLPAQWPPQDMNSTSPEPMPVPYLKNPPAVIPIDIGRQLFVDDFLIESTTMERQFYTARKYEGNPIFKPETELELNPGGNEFAGPKDGGIWWDPHLKCFRMWYEAGWLHTLAYATSTDGLNWRRPKLDVCPGTNQIVDSTVVPDSWSVVPDYSAADPYRQWKLFLRQPGGSDSIPAKCMVSEDGIHWTKPILAGPCGDKSTMFYNPFRKKWVFSLRSNVRGRSRHYWEADKFLDGCKWHSFEKPDPQAPVFWTGADRLDLPDPKINEPSQLYNLNAVAYESLMLGLFEIHLGPPNKECMKLGLPKITELNLAYSRDGFHWDRPDRRAFIPASRTDNWERGYVQSVGGICTINRDKLWFYYTAVQGNPDKLIKTTPKNGMYDKGCTGVAFLRRDGFASMNTGESGGTLTTRPVVFKGRYLFVNADAAKGELRAEILDKDGKVLPAYKAENCKPMNKDSTIYRIEWKHNKKLSALAAAPVRIRFISTHTKLYAFWVTPDVSGASHGYVAAGGHGFKGLVDTVGLGTYK